MRCEYEFTEHGKKVCSEHRRNRNCAYSHFNCNVKKEDKEYQCPSFCPSLIAIRPDLKRITQFRGMWWCDKYRYLLCSLSEQPSRLKTCPGINEIIEQEIRDLILQVPKNNLLKASDVISRTQIYPEVAPLIMSGMNNAELKYRINRLVREIIKNQPWAVQTEEGVTDPVFRVDIAAVKAVRA